MNRVLVIPAAGRGTRLGFDGPKALCPVNGEPMLRHLLRRYAPIVSHAVVVTSPGGLSAIAAVAHADALPVTCTVQPEPTGMLPAILCAVPIIEDTSCDEVWITWCDQVGISSGTLSAITDALAEHPSAALVFPTVRQAPPYIHVERDAAGRIVAVRQRREGDLMPDVGESDTGVFVLRRNTFLTHLRAYDAIAPRGDGTRERNFLPFIPWLARTAEVRTVPLADPREAIGVNTPDELALLEAYLRART